MEQYPGSWDKELELLVLEKLFCLPLPEFTINPAQLEGDMAAEESGKRNNNGLAMGDECAGLRVGEPC